MSDATTTGQIPATQVIQLEVPGHCYADYKAAMAVAAQLLTGEGLAVGVTISEPSRKGIVAIGGVDDSTYGSIRELFEKNGYSVLERRGRHAI